jgi:hypothetical protein
MTPLFKTDDLEHIEPRELGITNTVSSDGTATLSNLTVCKEHEQLSTAIGNITPATHQYFVTNGRWSAHDLLFYILEQTGPAKVFMSTWALSEKAVRLFLDGIKSGIIQELNAVFDRRLKIRKAEVMQLAESVCSKIVLIDCHAKVFVVKNDAWTVTVVGSANFTNNKRIEAGVICTVTRVGNRQIEWISKLLENEQPFLDE